MEDSFATPRPPPPVPQYGEPRHKPAQEPFSSSPAFGTPAYPIASRPPRPVNVFAPQINTNAGPTVLPILLPPQTLRPIAFRTLTKKHNLTLTSSGLGLLSIFVGKYCGSGWRQESLAERVLDEVAKAWRRSGGNVLLEDGPEKKLSGILKGLEPCMTAGRIDMGRLSRANSSIGSLSRQSSLDVRPGTNREDSQTSLGLSGLDVQEEPMADSDHEPLSKQDARNYMKVISAFKQPRLMYSTTKKSLEPVTTPPSLLPPVSHKVAMFRDRYNVVHQRLMRNESFQTPSFSMSGPPRLLNSASNVATIQQAYKITPISNLLGRSGSSHLLLGLLAHAPTGDLALVDLSGSVVLDVSTARPVPEDGVWFCPGMVVLIEGDYEEDGSNNSSLGGAGGIGGQIKGRFVAQTIAGPPAERRDVTLGIGDLRNLNGNSSGSGAGFGWVDFLGVGSEKVLGGQMRRIQRKMLGRSGADEDDSPRRSKILLIGECNLDNPRTLDSIRAILASYNATGESEDRPLAFVMMGNFVSVASMAGSTKGGGSIEYKEYFDALASILSEFPALLSNGSFIFVPGDNDPWASSWSAGASVAIPREGVPDIFTTRIRRAITAANQEYGRKEAENNGEVIWATNPSRMSLFGPVEELVLFRDDITGRIRRSALTLSKTDIDNDEKVGTSCSRGNDEADQDTGGSMEVDTAVEEATSHVPQSALPTNDTSDTDTRTARKLVKTILDQGHLSPFPLAKRPVLWDFASSLALYPLPTALVLADTEAPAFAVTYEGCHVMNPGRVIDELGARKGVAKFIEYDVKVKKGVLREVRF